MESERRVRSGVQQKVKQGRAPAGKNGRAERVHFSLWAVEAVQVGCRVRWSKRPSVLLSSAQKRGDGNPSCVRTF